ncbi:site-specific integrase [Acidobacteria bacterium AH-259-O06]|nr:site-specific integrase [Acidobacteria bacterium AH-259-O06]
MARGSLKKRYEGSWSIILDLGYQTDPKTGGRKRKQKWFTVRGTKRDAEAKLAKLLHQLNTHELVEPSKITFGEWLDQWVQLAIKPPAKRQRTYETYQGIIENHLKPHLGMIRLQELDVVHIERYYADSKLSQTTLELHHALISGALKAAQRKRFLKQNVAKLVDNKPHRPEGNEDAIEHCWNQDEARQFLATTKAFGPQPAAFYALALDTGARKGELCGLKWPNVDLSTRKVTIVEQLIKPGAEPVFGPPKRGKRTITITPETARLLKVHRKHQAELKMKNRNRYHDFGLVFAKEWEHMSKRWDTLGQPLQMNNLGQREFKKIIEKAKVRPIKFHGARHTNATLMLKAGVPVPVVSERLGHKGVEITMNIYQHVLPDMQEDAAAKLGAILF